MKKFILVGCGNWGNWWMNRFIPEVVDVAQCVAVVDANPAALERAGKTMNLPAEACYADVTTAFSERKVDFAVVAANIPAHLAVVRAILQAQPTCHILSEKPVAGSWEDCVEIERLVKDAGVKCALTFSHRYENDKQTFEKILRSGRYGKVNTIVGRLARHRSERVNPPELMLIDGGVHYLDMMRSFTGSDAVRVFAQAWNCPWPERGGNAICAFVQAEMASGVRALMEIELGGPAERNSWCNEYIRAECEKASVVLDRQEITACWTDTDGQDFEEKIPLLEGGHWKHDRIIRMFIDWIDGGSAPDICLEESMESMRLMCAAAQSVRTGQAVVVNTVGGCKAK